MAGTVKKLQFSEGTDVGAPSDLTLSTSSTTISAYVDDAAYVSDNGTASEGDTYLNSTTNKMRSYIGAAWRNIGPTPDDTQTLTNKTISGSSNTISVYDSNFSITDNSDATKIVKFEASGVTTATTRTLTVPDANLTIVGTATAQVITNKDIDGGTASNTNRITVPKDTTTNINALTRKAGTVLFDTTTNVLKYDDGSTLQTIASSATATASVAGVVTSFAPIIQSSIKTVSSADYTILDNDGYDLIEVTTGAANRTITLPTAADNVGRTITIKKVDSANEYVIVDGEGSETIDGATTYNVQGQYNAVTIKCNGTSWDVIKPVSPYSQQTLRTNNGYGSTNTEVLRWVTKDVDIGTNIAYADSSTLGGTFTIQKAGIYAVSMSVRSSGGSGSASITFNSTAQGTGSGTLAITSISANLGSSVSWTGRLAVNDVIRGVGNFGTPSTAEGRMTVTEIST